MKKYALSILFVSLFLSSFSVSYGMKKTIEQDDKNTGYKLHNGLQTDKQTQQGLSDIPDELLFKVFDYLGDGKTITSIRLVNNRLKELINYKIRTISLEDFKRRVFDCYYPKKPFICDSWDYTKIETLKQKLSNLIQKYNTIILIYTDY